MSICVSLACDRGKTLITVSDQKVSFGDFAADNIALKEYPLFKAATVQFAGNDVDHALPILRRAREKLKTANKPNAQPHDIAVIIDEAYREELQGEITRKLLRKRGFNIETFVEKGKAKMTPSAYLNLCSKIDQVSFSLKFLVSGFSPETGKARIFCIDGESNPKNYDNVGMWAIGSGAHAALSFLAYHAERLHFTQFSSVQEALYFAVASKFMAETSSEVGREDTFVCIWGHEKQLIYPSWDDLTFIKKLWEEKGAPRAPESLEKRMAQLAVFSKQSDLRTLKDQR